MGTLILNESKGSAAKTAEQQEATKKKNNTKLRELILTAAEESGFEATSELIASAKMRFTYRDEKIRPTSIYNGIHEFLKNHNHGAPTIKTVTEMVDKKTMQKKRLYDELCHYAETGDMKSYRFCRAEYAQL